mmetsp:Transcript_13631/g.22518  ORF Transcript_13631/g.22518 Transcript_13631/m.22518 type:complete len:129 (-) Transcript_13631:17-403(-)
METTSKGLANGIAIDRNDAYTNDELVGVPEGKWELSFNYHQKHRKLSGEGVDPETIYWDGIPLKHHNREVAKQAQREAMAKTQCLGGQAECNARLRYNMALEQQYLRDTGEPWPGELRPGPPMDGQAQ